MVKIVRKLWRVGAAAVFVGAVTLPAQPFDLAVAVSSATTVTPVPTNANCNGIVPTPGSENTLKKLIGGTLQPGGTAIFEISYPIDPADIGRTFNVLDCPVIGTDKDAVQNAQAYEFDFVPNNAFFDVEFTLTIPANVPLGTQYCNYAKTTGPPSSAQASNRKAGPACFVVGGNLQIEKHATGSPSTLLAGAEFSVSCPTTPPTTPPTAPPVVVSGLVSGGSAVTASYDLGSQAWKASGTADPGRIGISGPSGTSCTVTETAAPSGYGLPSPATHTYQIPVGTQSTVIDWFNTAVYSVDVAKVWLDSSGATTAAPTANKVVSLDCGGTVTHEGDAAQSVTGGTVCHVTESGVPTGWSENSASGEGTGDYTITADRTITVTNQENNADVNYQVDVVKVWLDSNGNRTTAPTSSPVVSLDCGAAVTHEGDTAQTVADGTVCHVTESGVPSGWAEQTSSGNGTGDYTIHADRTITVTNKQAPSSPVQTADLHLAKAAVPASGSTVQLGQTIAYSVTITNTGNGSATAQTVTDTLPAGVTYVSGSGSPAPTVNGQVLTWSVTVPAATAAGPGSVVITYSATVDQTATPGSTLTNGAVLGGLTAKTDHHVATGDLTLVKHVDKDAAEYGDTLHYTFDAAATGTADQTDVVVTDVVPDATRYVEGSATCPDNGACLATYDDATRTVTWQLGDLAAGATRTLAFDVTIATPGFDETDGLPVLRVLNSGLIASAQTQPASSNEVKTTVTAVLGVKIEKPTSRHPVVEPDRADRLPFTGSRYVNPSVVVVGMLLVGAGWAMDRAGRRRRV